MQNCLEVVDADFGPLHIGMHSKAARNLVHSAASYVPPTKETPTPTRRNRSDLVAIRAGGHSQSENARA